MHVLVFTGIYPNDRCTYVCVFSTNSVELMPAMHFFMDQVDDHDDKFEDRGQV